MRLHVVLDSGVGACFPVLFLFILEAGPEGGPPGPRQCARKMGWHVHPLARQGSLCAEPASPHI